MAKKKKSKKTLLFLEPDGGEPIYSMTREIAPVSPDKCSERPCPFPAVVDGLCRAHFRDAHSTVSMMPSTATLAFKDGWNSQRDGFAAPARKYTGGGGGGEW